ncbi:hypothetical protein ACFQPA_14645 [Halomarina halobia]|uniref:Uncharacterized protein n=1 Tax=Halomarina halobia TaxID=3033386 RepID=A0ABD6A7W2_9EURY|nr:hypothetical protein [Halomarina sp. PSR21]
MSTNTPLSTDRPAASEVSDLPSLAAQYRAAVLGSVRAVAFWLAVFLPALYVPLLVFVPDAPTVRASSVLLIALNVLALVVGHGHRRD